jgi:cell division protein FtsB
MADQEPASRRRAKVDLGTPIVRGRKLVRLFLFFIAFVVFVDALVGEKGLLATLRVRREYRQLEADIVHARGENARLREEARKLLEDPATIEAIARRELGLIRPGEKLFIIKNVPPASGK